MRDKYDLWQEQNGDLLPDSSHEDHQAHAAYDRRQARAALAAWDRAVAAFRAYVLDPSVPTGGPLGDAYHAAADLWIDLTCMSGPAVVSNGG